MATNTIIDTLALDTQVFVASGFCFTSKSFESLKKLILSGRLALVMADITVSEVKARIRQAVADELLLHRQFVNKASALHNSSIAEVQTLMTKLKDKAIAKDLIAQFDAFLKETKATILPATSLSGDEIFEKYFAGEPPFGDAQNKKSEFPDAFAVQALGEWADDNDTEMFVVSDDKLFREACDTFPKLHSHATLAKVLDQVASDNEQLATFLREQAPVHLKYIAKRASEEFESLGFWVDDEDGDADIEVTECTLDGEPEILEIDEDEAVLQLNFLCEYDAELSYSDSSTASYDEGDLVYVEHRDETVHRQRELEVEVRLSFDRKDLSDTEVLEVNLASPSKGFGIETRDSHGWPYK